MGPKYAVGAKVRVKAQDFLGRVLDPNITPYQNMTGEVLDSVNIVAFIDDSWAKIEGSGNRISVYHYTVKISEQIILHDVSEQSLVIVK